MPNLKALKINGVVYEIEGGGGSGTVTGVKGNAETTYRTGNVNLTPANIGALPDTTIIPTITDTYDGTSSDGMSGKAVKSAIDALDGTVTGSADASKTLTALSQTDGKISATFGDIRITKSQVSDFPSTMPPSSHYHGSINNDGKLDAQYDTQISNGDKLVIATGSNNQIQRSDITFDASTTNKALTPKGTFEKFLGTIITDNVTMDHADLSMEYVHSGAIQYDPDFSIHEYRNDISSASVGDVISAGASVTPASINLNKTTKTSNGSSVDTVTLSMNGGNLTVNGNIVKTSEATTTASGLMSSGDKTKLNGIATGAEVNQNAFSNVKVGSTTIQADSKTDTLELVAGANVTLTPDATNDKVTIKAETIEQIIIDTATGPHIISNDDTYYEMEGGSDIALSYDPTTHKITFDYTGGGGSVPTWGSITGTLSNQTDLQTALNGKASASFTKIKVGSTNVEADSVTDTLELVAGDNIKLTPDATNDKVTIAIDPTQMIRLGESHSYLLLGLSIQLVVNNDMKFNVSNGGEMSCYKVTTNNIECHQNMDITGYIKAGGNISSNGEIQIGDGSVHKLSNKVDKPDVLWTNSSPTSNFAGQTITLSKAIYNYTYYEVIYKFSASVSNDRMKSTGRIPVNCGAWMDISHYYNYYRSIDIPSGTSMVFSNGVRYNTYGNSTTNNQNGYAIPYQVLGWKY